MARPLLRHRRRRPRSLPDTGTGAELYAVIGQPPRQLDRNIAVVGRVVEGIEFSPPCPARRAMACTRMPPTARRSSRSAWPATCPPTSNRISNISRPERRFARYADLRAHRHDDFIKVAAIGADICSIPVPIRRHPAS
jgi:peptidylprolyl isomerase